MKLRCMERSIKKVDSTTVVASMIPARDKMYEIIDNCTRIETIHFLTPTGRIRTLDGMKEVDNMDYHDIKPDYPIDCMHLEYSKFSLKYDCRDTMYYDNWEWVFKFKKKVNEEKQLEIVNDIIDIIA